MQDVVAEMKARERKTGIYPRGAGPGAASKYAAKARASDRIPTDPKGASAFWEGVFLRHAGRVPVTARGLAMQAPQEVSDQARRALRARL